MPSYTAIDSKFNVQISNEEFSTRVETLLRARGCSKAWLAKELGISKQSLNYLLKSKKGIKFISELALIFNVNPNWLKTGEGKAHTIPQTSIQTIPLYELSDILSGKKIFEITCSERILFKNENRHKYFAILFKNYPSMSAKFNENSILIFDQDLIPQNGSYILADAIEEGAVFRQYYKEKETIILKPSDEIYDSIKCASCNILGTLIEIRIKF